MDTPNAPVMDTAPTVRDFSTGPKACPYCGTLMGRDRYAPAWICPNYENHPAAKRG